MSAPALPGVEPGLGEDEVPRLAAAFGRCALPRTAWSHRAHLLVGLWYASTLPADEALDAMRAGIQRLNAVHGVVTTPSGGYHETITGVYMRLIGNFVVEDGGLDGWAMRAERLLARHGEKDHLLLYYSRERLMSPEARFGWVEPDLRPLP